MSSVPGYFHEANLLLASNITALHPGTGRSPGVVDLPVQKDPFGIPFIPASGLKGAVKTRMAHLMGNGGTCINKDGEIDCGQCSLICCLLGREPHSDVDEGASAVGFVDLFPLLLPVPSLNLGLLYATSPLLLSRALGVAQAIESLSKGRENIKAISGWLSRVSRSAVERVGQTGYLASRQLEGREVDLLGDPVSSNVDCSGQGICFEDLGSSELSDVLSGMNPVYAQSPLERLVVVPDHVMSILVDRVLLRVSRVRLNRRTKTVQTGALWTEEYIPQSTLFVGGVFYTRPRSSICGDGVRDASSVASRFREMLLGNSRGTYLFIGGNETVGKGLVYLTLL